VQANFLKIGLYSALALLVTTGISSCALLSDHSTEQAEFTRIHLQLGVRYLEMNKLLLLLVLFIEISSMRLSRFYSISRGNSFNNITLRTFNNSKVFKK